MPVINNQSGALTLDFIFAFVLVLSMTFLLGIFSFSLSVIEGIQYLTFSSSRAYYAANVTERDQRKAAQDKFDELSKTGSYRKLLKKDWFNVTVDSIGDAGRVYESTSSRDVFTGVRAKVVVGLLNQNLPIFGTTEADTPFVTYVTSFIGRESSVEECMNVVKRRLEAIARVGGYPVNPANYTAFDDNGC